MQTRARLLPLLVMAAALFTFAACGGDDSQAERRTADNQTPSPTTAANQSGGTSTGGTGTTSRAATPAPADATRTVQVQCSTDLKAFRFNGQLSLTNPQGSSSSAADLTSIVGSLLQDVKFSGAFVAPDRTQFKLDGGQNSPLGTIEFIQIGGTNYTKLGTAPWQQSTGGPNGFTDQLDPREFCRQIEQGLSGNVPSRKEKVNGVDATRYDYDRAALQQLGNGFLGSVAGPDDELPENIKMSVWVSDKEKFPVKMQVNGSGKQDGEDYSFDMELNVTDLNGNVSIDAPR